MFTAFTVRVSANGVINKYINKYCVFHTLCEVTLRSYYFGVLQFFITFFIFKILAFSCSPFLAENVNRTYFCLFATAMKAI